MEAGVASLPSSIELVKSGKLRALALSSKERWEGLPDVPTLKELGIDFDASSWNGFSVPKGTPKENIKIIHDAFKMAMNAPSFKEFAKKQGMALTYLGPEEFGKFLREQDPVWLKIIEYGGFKASK